MIDFIIFAFCNALKRKHQSTRHGGGSCYILRLGVNSLLLKKFILFYFWLHGLFIAVHGFSLVVVCGLLVEMSFLVAEHRLWSAASVVVAYGLSCPETCGILPDQGSNLCPWHWQVDS